MARFKSDVGRSCFSSYLRRHLVSMDTGLSSWRWRLRSRCSWGADNHHTSGCGQNKIIFVSSFCCRTKEERKLYAAAVSPNAVLSELPSYEYMLLALQKHFTRSTGTIKIILIIVIIIYYIIIYYFLFYSYFSLLSFILKK